MLKLDLRLDRRVLDGLKASVRREVVSELRLIGADTAIEAQRRVPVRTGALRASIKAEAVDEATVEVKAEASYALFVDRGTRYQAGTPFFTPAVEQARAEMPERLRRAAQRGLKG